MNKRKIIAFLLTFCILIGLNSNILAAVEDVPVDEENTTVQTPSDEIILDDTTVEATDSTGGSTETEPSQEIPPESTISVQEKAEILNKIGIISGDGNGNFNLDSQLRRSEAATFIVKLLGKDSYIKDNKDKYKATAFKDVKLTDWFIPYVSYCEQNSIISGMGNGRFGPNEYISEKAFLVLVMKCLGYTSDAGDFSWETVLGDAYRLGLVTDYEYQQKTEDNTDYVREDVVNVIYEALTLKLKDNSITLLQSLVNEGAIIRYTAYETGLLKDTTIASINTITPQNDSRISMLFSEQINLILPENITIYETGRKSKTLAVTKIISQSNGKLVISTEKQTADKEYTVEITNVTDLEGNIDKKLTTTFKGYKIIEIKSDLFKISRVENISTTEIKIYFTHPVNENIEVPSYYQIFENDQLFVEGKASTLKVNVLAGENNAVSLTLYNTVLDPDNEYRVNLSGNLVSVYGTKLNNGSGDEAAFIPIELVSEEFTVTGAYAIGYNTIQLNFNKEVNPVLAKQIYNYNVTDSLNNSIQVTQASAIGADGKSVSLTIGQVLDKTKIYNVMINRLTDIDKQEEIVEKTFNFSGNYPDKVDLIITNVTVTDLEIMTIVFNRAIDQESAMKEELYTIAEVSGVYKSFAPDNVSFDKQNPNQVKLYFKSSNALKNLTSYKVRVNPLFKDYTGASVNRVLEYGLVPISVPTVKLSMSRAAIISSDTIMVKFAGKEISTDSPNSNAQNYSLEYTINGESYKKIPIAVTYIDKETIVLKFDALDSEQIYTLKCNELKSYAGDIIDSDELKCTVSIGQ